MLAVKIVSDIKKGTAKGIIKYCTTHWHVRGQYFTNPAFTAHFCLFCMVTSGRDQGDYKFELVSLENCYTKNYLHFNI